MKTLASELATSLATLKRIGDAHPAAPYWEDKIYNLTEMLPSGSGIDSGITIDDEASTAEKLVLNLSFHHMDDGGFYDGWTDHTVTVTPSWEGINVDIDGDDRDGIHDYLGEMLRYCLSQDVSDLMEQIRATHFPAVKTA